MPPSNIKKKPANGAPKKKQPSEDLAIKELRHQMDAVDIANGRIANVPLSGLVMEGGVTLMYWSWQSNAKWFIDIEIMHKTEGPKQYKAYISRDGKHFHFEAKLLERFLRPRPCYTLDESFGSDLEDDHPRYQKKMELLNSLLEKNDHNFDSPGLKNCISIPLPFICKRVFNDPHVLPKKMHQAYSEQFLRTDRKITEYDYIIRACCESAADPVLDIGNDDDTPCIKSQGTVLTAKDVLDSDLGMDEDE